jgi:hypothetical protein
MMLKWICAVACGAGLLCAQIPEDPLTNARTKLKEHDPDGAYEDLQKALAQKADSVELQALLGDVDYLRGEFTEAEMAFKSAIRLDSKCAPAWVGLGKVFQAASLRAQARLCYRTAYEADPRDLEAQRRYASTLTAAERLPMLESYLAKVGDGGDPDIVSEVRQQIAELKWAGGRAMFALSSPMERTENKLSRLMHDANNVRGYALPVAFNGGKPLHLLVDSGAGGIVLNRKSAERAGLPRIADAKFGGIGDAGDRTGYTAMAETVQVGQVSFRNCPIVVSEKEPLTGQDGLIGTNIFSRFLVTLDLQKMVLRLDPLPKRQTPEDDWSDPEKIAEFGGFTRFWHVGHDILLPTRVNGAKPVLFLIDTGGRFSLIDPTYARQFTGVRSEDLMTVRGASGKVAKVQSAEHLTFEFGHYRMPVSGVMAIPLTKVSHDTPRMTGIFGAATLVNFRTQIDYRDGLINLEYIGPK